MIILYQRMVGSSRPYALLGALLPTHTSFALNHLEMPVAHASDSLCCLIAIDRIRAWMASERSGSDKVLSKNVTELVQLAGGRLRVKSEPSIEPREGRLAAPLRKYG
jgi:hypothetical protein